VDANYNRDRVKGKSKGGENSSHGFCKEKLLKSPLVDGGNLRDERGATGWEAREYVFWKLRGGRVKREGGTRLLELREGGGSFGFGKGRRGNPKDYQTTVQEEGSRQPGGANISRS